MSTFAASMRVRAALTSARSSRVIGSRSFHASLPSAAETPKPSVALLASLRKARPVPLTLAREALTACQNDVQRAIEYLDSASSSSTAKKAEKLTGRDTKEGVIAVSLLGGKRVGMVHVACETDFVARNEVFLKLARSVSGTAAFLDVPQSSGEAPRQGVDPILAFPVPALMSAPIISLPSETPSADGTTSTSPATDPTSEMSTISQSMLASLSQTGENLRLLRATSFACPFPSSSLIRYVPSAYAHGGSTQSSSSSSTSATAPTFSAEGKVGGVVVLSVEALEGPIAGKIHGPGGEQLEAELATLARNVARQVVGFPTRAVRREGSDVEGLVSEEILLEQQAMMLGKMETVAEVLKSWSAERGLKVDVVGMRRWSVTDPVGEEEMSPPALEADMAAESAASS